MLQQQFNAAAEKVLATAGSKTMSFLQLRGVVDGEDNFEEQNALDADILKQFDMRKLKLETLEDLVLFGIALRPAAGSVFMHVVEELKRVTARKVMFAVDQYNVFESPSPYYWNRVRISGQDLCVPRALLSLSRNKAANEAYQLANGLVLCATSHTHEEGRDSGSYADRASSLPLLIQVPNYNAGEFFSTMRLYAAACKTADWVTLPQLLTYRSLCQSNPEELRKNCYKYFAAMGLNEQIDELFQLPLRTEEERRMKQHYDELFKHTQQEFKNSPASTFS